MRLDTSLFRGGDTGGGSQVNPGLRNLIVLQDLEQKIADLQKQISEVPIKIQQSHLELEGLKKAHSDQVERSHELTKRRRSHEGTVDLLQAKLSKLKDQLMSVKTNKEYTAMLHEIQTAEGQIRAEEDKVLEIMEESETMEKELGNAEKEFKSKSGELLANISRCEESVPGLEAEVNRLLDQKAAMETTIEAELLERYRKIADARKGVALAEAKDELCTACHVRIRPQVYADVLRTETIYSCDSCSRLLFSREAL
jgi:predicted  nucleic acid-binding Zn-ribbon protein